MKKLLAFLLVLVMILSVSLVACNKKGDNTDDGEGDDWDDVGGTTTSDTVADGQGNGDTNIPTTLTFTDCADFTAYIAYPVVLRSSAADTAKTGITLNFGDSVLVTQKSTNNQWYMVSYGESTYYLYAYVTVTSLAEVTFDDVTPELTTVIDDKQTNLRNYPCYGGDYDSALLDLGIVAISGVNNATSQTGKLTVTGINQTKTWIRVQYTSMVNGVEKVGTYYCRPAYLAKYQGTQQTPDGGVTPA